MKVWKLVHLLALLVCALVVALWGYSYRQQHRCLIDFKTGYALEAVRGFLLFQQYDVMITHPVPEPRIQWAYVSRSYERIDASDSVFAIPFWPVTLATLEPIPKRAWEPI